MSRESMIQVDYSSSDEESDSEDSVVVSNSPQNVHVSKTSETLQIPATSSGGTDNSELPMLAKRAEVLREIYTSERSYLKTLTEIVQIYLMGLRSAKQFINLPLEKVFLNVQEITNTHKQIAELLRATVETTDGKRWRGSISCRIGAVYSKFAEQLKCYVTYCKGYDDAVKTLEEWEKDTAFAAFLDERRKWCDADTSTLTLSSLLIAPVQRICRYPLLFHEVLKNTPPDHGDRDGILKALETLTTLTKWVNEEKSTHFNIKRMLAIAEKLSGFPGDFVLRGRVLIHEGTFLVTSSIADESSSGSSADQAFLFNDCLMWCSVRKRGQLKFRGLVDLQRVSISKSGGDTVKIESSEKKILIEAMDQIDGDMWNARLVETSSKRSVLWRTVRRKRQLQKQRFLSSRNVMNKSPSAMELELAAEVRRQKKIISSLLGVVEQLCDKQDLIFPSVLRESLLLDSSPTLSRRAVHIGNGGAQINFPDSSRGTPCDYVVRAVVDVLITDDSSSFLSFTMAELLLVSCEVSPGIVLARPFNDSEAPPLQVNVKDVAKVVKKGTGYRMLQDGATSLLRDSQKAEQEEEGGGGDHSSDLTTTMTTSNALRKGTTLLKVGTGESLVRTSGSSSSSSSSSSSALNRVSNAEQRRSSSSAAANSPLLYPSSSSSSEGVFMGPDYRESSPGIPDHSQEMILKSGWLSKKGHSRRNWKKRYFVLTEHRLYYYESEKSVGKRAPLGVIPLFEKFLVGSIKHAYGLAIPDFRKRVWELRAYSQNEIEEWKTELEKLCKKFMV